MGEMDTGRECMSYGMKWEYLKRELKQIWDMPVKVIPVVVGALGTTPNKLKQQLSDIGI